MIASSTGIRSRTLIYGVLTIVHAVQPLDSTNSGRKCQYHGIPARYFSDARVLIDNDAEQGQNHNDEAHA